MYIQVFVNFQTHFFFYISSNHSCGKTRIVLYRNLLKSTFNITILKHFILYYLNIFIFKTMIKPKTKILTE